MNEESKLTILKNKAIEKITAASEKIDNKAKGVIEAEKNSNGKRTPLFTAALTVTFATYVAANILDLPFPMLCGVLSTFIFFGGFLLWQRKNLPKAEKDAL